MVLRSPKHLGGGKAGVPVQLYKDIGPVMSLEGVVMWLNPLDSPEQLLVKYRAAAAKYPVLASPSGDEPTFERVTLPMMCAHCGVECSQQKSRCGRCMRSALRVYYCSKACQTSDWPSHKTFCLKGMPSTEDMPSAQGAAWSKFMERPITFVQV